MIYVVSGFPRTGTSMMMQCLSAGGLIPAYAEHRERLNKHGDAHYKPNRGGFYEVGLDQYGSPGWPLQYQGRLIKVMCWGLDSMSVNPDRYRVVLMMRDPEEIRQSYDAAFGQRANVPPDYWARMECLAERMRNRRDVEAVGVFRYREVVDNPADAFAKVDWPIDCEAAAAAVKPDQCRFRRELLTEGI